MKRIAITQRREQVPNRNEIRDALDVMWSPLLYKLGFLPIPVCSELAKYDQYIESLKPDGILLSGGNDIGESLIRDNMETRLLDYALKSKLPVLGVCRGMQMINHYFGGQLVTIENHVAKKHSIHGQWAEDRGYTLVNSYHNQGIIEGTLAIQLIPLAEASDGVIEAVKHITLPWTGIMWHPERENEFSRLDIDLILSIY